MEKGNQNERGKCYKNLGFITLHFSTQPTCSSTIMILILIHHFVSIISGNYQTFRVYWWVYDFFFLKYRINLVTTNRLNIILQFNQVYAINLLFQQHAVTKRGTSIFQVVQRKGLQRILEKLRLVYRVEIRQFRVYN